MMQDNLTFCGIEEEQDDDHNQKKLNCTASLRIREVHITHCHLPPKPRKARSNERSRNVVATFADNADVHHILSSAKLLKACTPLYINQQNPEQFPTGQ